MTAGIGIVTGDFGRVALLDMDTPLTTHAHRHCHVVMKIDGADQRFFVEGKCLPLTQDVAVVVNSWQEHSYLPLPADRRTLYLAFYIDPEWLGDQDRQFSGFANARFFQRPSVRVGADVRRHSRQLTEMMTCIDQDPGTVEALVLDIVARLARASGSSPAAPRRAADFRIRRALRHMHDRYDRPYDYDLVAREAGLSRSRFNVLFKDSVGVTPAIYGNAIRLEASVEALRSNIGANATAEKLGFSAPGNFNRFFQTHTGVTPAAYRRAMSDMTTAPRHAHHEG
ncbi:MAG: helix-turn-helix transcriptional regulator [Rhizobiaceae bacterium]|nr:helix-turn-helix transcriptional regulator [Rhizobiaceae bacterium]